MNKQIERRAFWQFPWGYRESFFIVTGLMLVGFMLEFASGGKVVQLPTFPMNIILLLVFVFYLVLTQALVKGPVMTWLSSVPAAMATMTAFTFLILLMGFIPQGEPEGFSGKIGLHHIHTSKPYIIIAVFMLTILGYTIIRRLRQKINLKNIAFFINHAGLFIVIAAASIGSSDMLRLKMPVMQEQTTNIAFPDNKHQAQMPFSIHLNSFSIEEYEPELIIFDVQTGSPIIEKGSKLPFIREGKQGNLLNYDFEIMKFFSFAYPEGDEYIKTEEFGSTHAALVRIKEGEKISEGWISCGNFMYSPRYLMINNKHALGMATPKVRSYLSVVDIIRDGKTVEQNISISVNKPLKHKDWKIYQFSYDNELGRWSQMSIFEIIRDPWLPVVYTGIFMLLLGSVYLLWVGRKV
jgi:hypothetical protein